jgi:hypothetical protein
MLASPRGTGPVLSRRPQQPTRRAWHRAHRVPGARMRAPELPARNPAHAGLSALYPSCGEARAALLCDESGAAPTSEVPRWAPRLAGSACADRHRGLPCFPRTQGCQGHRRARRLAALLRTNSRAELTSDFGSFRALLAGNSRLSPQPTRDALSAEDRDGSEMAAPAFPARAVASATPDLSVAADEDRASGLHARALLLPPGSRREPAPRRAPLRVPQRRSAVSPGRAARRAAPCRPFRE